MLIQYFLQFMKKVLKVICSVGRNDSVEMYKYKRMKRLKSRF